MRILRKYIEKLNWLAANTRPDIAVSVLELAKNQKKATLQDLRNMNKVIKKVSEKDNKVVFERVAEKEKICVVGISDALYNQEGH